MDSAAPTSAALSIQQPREQERLFLHYCYGARLSEHDSGFLVCYIMLAVTTRIYCPPKLQLVTDAVILCCASTLLLKVLFKRIYIAWRTRLVFFLHVMMILCRAVANYHMALAQATGWRAGRASQSVSEGSIWSYLLAMCNTSGGLQRVFEVASLQQPFSSNALLAGISLLLQGAPGVLGFRVAYTNAFFYSAHQLHDHVATVANMLLSSLVPLPMQHQDNCSSCAGLVLYGTVLLFTLLAAPLYVSYSLETAARRRFLAGMAAVIAGAVPEGPAAGPPGAAGPSRQVQQQGQLQDSAAAASGGAARGLLAEVAASSPAAGRACILERGPAALGSVAREGPGSSGALEAALLSVDRQAASSNLLNCIVMHMAALAAIFLLCDLTANFVALVLLPRVLSSHQLQLWCPAQPYIPYKIAAEVYEYF